MHSDILRIAFETFVSFLLGLVRLVAGRVVLVEELVVGHFGFILDSEFWSLIHSVAVYDSQLRWTRMFCCFSKYLQPVDCAYLLKVWDLWSACYSMRLH